VGDDRLSTRRTSIIGWSTALAALIALLALAFRLNGLGYVRQNLDRAYPHGLGVAIREAIADGRFDQLPATSVQASINLPNPAGASYFYALLTAIEPSAYAATALNAMLGAAIALIAFDLTKRLFGTWAAFAAGSLAASSAWAAWVSRGAWLQGALEAISALTFWLLVNGLVKRNARHLFAALAWVAAGIQTYLVAFGLLAQVGLLALSKLPTLLRRPALRRAAVAGMMMCALSVALYTAAARPTISALDAPSAVAAEDQVNLDPLNHVLRIASGRDFENTFVELDTPAFDLRDRLSDARAGIVDAMMLFGLVLLLGKAFTSSQTAGAGASRLLLIWLALPVISALLIANLLMKQWKVHVFYMLLTSPGPYILAGAPLALAEQLHRRLTGAAKHALIAGLAAFGAFGLFIPWWNAAGEIDAVRRFPYHHDGPYSLPLVWQMRLAERWRALGCRTLHMPEDARWQASLLGTARPAHSDEIRIKGDATIWQIHPTGLDCALLIAEAPPLAHAEPFTMTIPGQKRTDRTPVVLTFYRAKPIPSAQTPPADALTVNLGEGWRLLKLDAPDSARAGEQVTVIHEWLVGQPPNEPYWFWYFAPFVKLFAPDERMVLEIDNAPAILGYAWRAGYVQVSAVRFTLPADLLPGNYTLELSLFDPNQKKNAVYFHPSQPQTPIVTIPKTIRVLDSTAQSVGSSSPLR
jgi:hypothetical protein